MTGMEQHDGARLRGSWRTMITRRGRRTVGPWTPNLLTNAYLTAIRDRLYGQGTGFELTWVAFGGDNGTLLPLDATNTGLGDEQGRVPVTSRVASGPAELTSTAVIDALTGNGQIEELGWFGGAATQQAGSGLLIARVFYSRLKDASESIQVERVDTVAAA